MPLVFLLLLLACGESVLASNLKHEFLCPYFWDELLVPFEAMLAMIL